MGETLFTISLLVISIALVCIRYVLPLGVAVVGVKVKKKNSTLGIALIVCGLLVEAVSIGYQIVSLNAIA